MPAARKTDLRTEDGLRMPPPRGKLDEALAKKNGKLQLQIVAPESPRPAEMLEGVAVSGADDLTADDAALHELLVSRAYEDDRFMSDGMHSLEMAQAMRYLGGRTERSDVRQSLNRLKRTTVSYGGVTKDGRRYEDVALIESWIEIGPGFDTIRYRLPEPLRELMRRQPSYGYVELAALPKMRSKFSSRLYRKLALATSRRKWEAGGDNTVIVSGTPDEIADWIGFPREKDGRVHVGKLRKRFLSRVEADLADVRAFTFKVDLDEPGGRGNPLVGVKFVLRLNPRSRHMTASTFNPANAAGFRRVGGKDLPGLRVESRTWRRAAREFGRTLGLTHQGFHELWQVALQEMLSEEAVTDGYATREYRGERLRAAIESRGADAAAWGFVCEEADSPDLAVARGIVRKEIAAEQARMERIGWGKKKDKPAPAFLSQEEAAPSAPAAKPVPQKATLEDCREVVLTLDRVFGNADARALADALKARFWTGTRKVMMTVRCLSGDRTAGYFAASAADMETVAREFRRYLDGDIEYVAVTGREDEPRPAVPARVAPAVPAGPVVLVDTPGYRRTVYPALKPAGAPAAPKAPAPEPGRTVVDDPFDYLDAQPLDARDVLDDCPF
jgi:hypothetical protein